MARGGGGNSKLQVNLDDMNPCSYKARCGDCDWCADDAKRHRLAKRHQTLARRRHGIAINGQPYPAGMEAGGRRMYDHMITSMAAETAKVAAKKRTRAKLTPRQVQIVGLIARGQTNEAIAARLGIGLETVKTHVKDALSRTGAANRAQLAIIAKKQGQI